MAFEDHITLRSDHFIFSDEKREWFFVVSRLISNIFISFYRNPLDLELTLSVMVVMQIVKINKNNQDWL
jgi:hypothetical protein